MSYDLFFQARDTEAICTRDAFLQYFNGRTNYESNDEPGWYSNEDTGVYFLFEWSDNGGDLDQGDGANSSTVPVSFNLNYYRPHIFGLEAELELAAFTHHFQLGVFDPQNHGMGEGEYSREGFLNGWNHGNEFAYRAIFSQESNARVLTLPSETLEHYWSWNFRRTQRQNEMGDAVFVPKIFLLDKDGVVQSAVVWGDGIPILLPKVDFVIAPREQLAPKRWFRRSAQDTVLFGWAELESMLQGFSRRAVYDNCFELCYAKPPASVERLFRNKVAAQNLPQIVRFENVLDQELMLKARQS